MSYEKMHELVDSNFDDLVTGIQKFVGMDSVADEALVDMSAADPFGPKMTKVLSEFLAYAKAEGFTTKNVANAAGYAECGEGDTLIGLLCHLDVVPTGSREQWKHDPFTAVIEDGKLYGRGTIDDKGPALASLFAMKAIRDSGIQLKRRYRLIVGLDEESGFSRCLGKYLAVEETPNYSFSPDAFFPVINAEKGIIRFDLVRKGEQTRSDVVLDKMIAGDRYNVVPDSAAAYFSGDTAKAKTLLTPLADEDSTVKEEGGKVILSVKGLVAHAMEPDRGKNALQKLLKKLVSVKEFAAMPEIATAQRLISDRTDGEQLGIVMEDAASGKLTCNAAAIKLENGSYSMRFDVRYPVTADSEMVIQSIREAAAAQGAELIIPQHKKPLYLPAEMPFIQMLVGAYNDLTGEQGKPFSIGGGSYCRFLDNAVSFGPVFPHEQEMAHHPNEFVSLDSLRKMTHIYAEALYRINERSIG